MEGSREGQGIAYVTERSSPILGKQKARDPTRKRSFTEAALLSLKVLLLLLLLVSTWFAVSIVRSGLLHSPRFNIAIKDIRGLHYVPESYVLMRINDLEEHSQNLFALDLDKLRESIELLPWVKEAMVRRVFPDKLLIDVKERVPIAYARIDHRTCLVDDEGILLENKLDTLSRFDAPVIIGMEEGFEQELLSRNKKRIARYQSLVKSLDGNGAHLSQDISEVYLEDPDNVAVILDDDTILVYLGADGFQEKFRRYMAMSHELKQKYSLLDSVDLRYQNQVLISTANQKAATVVKN